MNKFIKKILIFTYLILSGLGVLERYVERKAYHTDIYASMAREYEANRDSIQILFLGTSMFNLGLDKPSLPPHSLKLAVSGQNLTHEYYISREVIPNLPSLKTVVLELSYFTLRDDRDFRKNNIKLVSWTGPTIYFNTKRYSRFSKWGWELSDANKFREILFFNPETPAAEKANPDPIPTDEELHQIFSKQTAREMPTHTNDQRYYKYNRELFEGIISLAHGQGAEIVIVIPPTPPEYREATDSVQLAEMYATASSMQQKYGARVIDCFADRRYPRSAFLDYFHLREGKGSSKFTANLLRDLTADSLLTIVHN